MTIHTFPGAAPARRVLSGNTASEEQRRIALAMINDSFRYGPLPDAHNCELLADMNAKRAQSEPVPLAGVLLIMSAFGFFGAALAVWVLV
ncbi:MAG TPA: hypothetical protein PKV23_07085 [Aestuariivirga sp.]|nr:hypothetical protein [Aestuariivirga sp.]